jgi:hypothetical protein
MSLVMSLEPDRYRLTFWLLNRLQGGPEERGNPRMELCRKTYFCLTASLLVLLPAVLAVVVFHANPAPEPLLLLAREGPGRRELVVVGAAVPPGFPFTPSQLLVQGRVRSNCNITLPVQIDFLLLNMTDPRCLSLLEDKATVLAQSNISALVVLDGAEAVGWRVSSPYSSLGPLSSVWQRRAPVLLVRKQDWAGLETQLATGQRLRLALSRDQIDRAEVDMFPCKLDSKLQLMVEEQEGDGERSPGAVLHKDGRISQDVTVNVSCTFYGSSACKRWRMQKQQSWRATCRNISNVDVSFVSNGEEIFNAIDILLPSNNSQMTCCKDSNTFIQVFSKQGKLVISSNVVYPLTKSCKFSDYVEARCNALYGQLDMAQFCQIKGFVIYQYQKISCYNKDIITNICNKLFNCYI